MTRVLACLLMLFSAFTSARAEPPALPRPGDVPAEQAWTQFLAHADSAQVAGAIRLADSMYDEEGNTDAGACAVHAEAFANALRQAPVSLALWYTEMDCADAVADETRSEAALSAFAALSRHALSGNPAPASSAPPMPALNESDAWLMAAALELQVLHAYYPMPLQGPHFLLQMSVYDPVTEREQIWIFDLADSWRQLVVRDPAEVSPAFTAELRQAVIDSGDEYWDGGASAHLARVVRAFEHGDRAGLAERLSALSAEDFGAARALFGLCIASAAADCSERAIDSLLDYAEAGSSEALWLLALAHAVGRGIPQDAEAANRLLDRADRRLGGASATQAAAREWLLRYHHPRLPDALIERLRAQAGRGDLESAELALLHDLDRSAREGLSADQRQRVAAAANARDPRIRARHAALLHQMGDPEGERRLQALAAAGEPEAAAHLLRIHGAGAAGRKAKARVAWHRLAGLHGSAASSSAMGWHLLQQGRFLSAQEWFSSALVQREAASGGWGGELTMHSKHTLGFTPNTITQLLEATLIRQEHVSARSMLANLLLMSGIDLHAYARRPIGVLRANRDGETGASAQTLRTA